MQHGDKTLAEQHVGVRGGRNPQYLNPHPVQESLLLKDTWRESQEILVQHSTHWHRAVTF